MTWNQRLLKLIEVLKDNDGFIYIELPIPRLQFLMTKIYWNGKSAFFCMDFKDELHYVDISELSDKEIKTLVKKLEDVLING